MVTGHHRSAPGAAGQRVEPGYHELSEQVRGDDERGGDQHDGGEHLGTVAAPAGRPPPPAAALPGVGRRRRRQGPRHHHLRPGLPGLLRRRTPTRALRPRHVPAGLRRHLPQRTAAVLLCALRPHQRRVPAPPPQVGRPGRPGPGDAEQPVSSRTPRDRRPAICIAARILDHRAASMPSRQPVRHRPHGRNRDATRSRKRS